MDKDQWKISLHASQMHMASTFVRGRSYLCQSSRHHFKSSKKLKEEMDLKIDACVGENQSQPPAPARVIKKSNMSVRPLDEDEMNAQLKKLNELSVKPVTSEFVQILHTGNQQWVCTSSVGCLPGIVNLYDSLFHDIIANEVEEQLKDLMANNFTAINIVPVQQQGNGSNGGVFSIAFATCIVYGRNPSIVTFDVPQMRPHLPKCLKTGVLRPFPRIYSNSKLLLTFELAMHFIVYTSDMYASYELF